MSTRLSLYPCQAINKRGRTDPDRRPLRSQPIPHKPDKVVVQMVVYSPSITTCKPVRTCLLKACSEDTLSAFQESSKGLVRPDPLLCLGFCVVGGPGSSR